MISLARTVTVTVHWPRGASGLKGRGVRAEAGSNSLPRWAVFVSQGLLFMRIKVKPSLSESTTLLHDNPCLRGTNH